ncbi:MAG: NAD(P)H-dependent oxidoreductase subunit E [Rhodoferax sp.]|nr:NAD(P)H-dependent oxidoreductase subunit E [Rhodoferax sp.]
MNPTLKSIPIVLARPETPAQRAVAHLKGRQPEGDALLEVSTLVGVRPPEGYRRDLLIEQLHLLNDHFGGLFERHLVALASMTGLPMAEVFEVASFYHHFEVLKDDQTPPTVTLRVCQSQSCAMAGAQALKARLLAVLGPKVRVVDAPCIGRCEQAPAALLGHRALVQTTETSVLEALNSATGKADIDELAPDFVAYRAYREAGGYGTAAAIVNSEEDPEDIFRALEDSGLRGLGGAGFPAARKWRIVREQPGPRYMAVNIDEGEPGTFKDRYYLERDPHRFLEGMLIAAQVAGTERCYIYLRDEYHALRRMLQRELAALQADPPCPLPQMELRRGAGAYVCGEESAMIESIEGKRGQPRLRPPYIAQAGLFGRPTLEHNLETLHWVRDILEKGPTWFTGFGRHGRTGLRSFSVSGRVRQPGVKLAPAGITLRELIDEYCGGMADGHSLYAYLPGGASGGILPASLANVPLDFDTLQPHGCFIGSAAVVVLSQHDRARDAALNATRFFADESCGQCTPCRVGTVKAAALMEAPVWDLPTLNDLSAVMVDASICGLGQAAPNPLRCVQQYFAHEIGG